MISLPSSASSAFSPVTIQKRKTEVPHKPDLKKSERQPKRQKEALQQEKPKKRERANNNNNDNVNGKKEAQPYIHLEYAHQ